jgi:imidazolonepropionase-like amidohydrolase
MATIAIVNGNLIDGTGADPVPNATLLIEDNTISRIGPASQVSIPAGATVIDAAGMTIMPGLMDCHVHLTIPGGSTMNLVEPMLTSPSLKLLYAVPHSRATLEAGITMVRDVGMTPAGVRQAIEKKLFPGPRLQVSVSIMSQTGGRLDGHLPCCADEFAGNLPDVPSFVVDGPIEVRKKVREILRAGADWIKLCATGGILAPNDNPLNTQFSLEELEAAVAEAATQGKAEVSILERAEKQPGAVAPYAITKTKQAINDHRASFRKAVEAGVNIAMGTDAGACDHGDNIRELELMVQNGMTPMQSIVASTLNSAKLLRVDKKLGSLEEGKLADVLVVDGDPLADIRILQDKTKLVAILKDGEIYKDKTSNRAMVLA